MTEVHTNIVWEQQSISHIKEEIVYDNHDYVVTQGSESSLVYDPLPEEVPMIVIESNQVSAETDAPMIIVANEVSEQIICAEEEVETESDMGWYCSPPIAAHEETVVLNSEVGDIKKERRQGRVALPYLDVPEYEVPLNNESYATYHPFPCEFCCRRFKKRANLVNHMVAHQTVRPHSCNICSSRFMRKCDLVNHQKIHSYVPNRENRDDIEEDYKYSPLKKKKSKGSKGAYSRKSVSKEKMKHSSPDSQNYFKPTSYVDEDVKLLLEMTNRLHEKSSGSDKTPEQAVEAFVGSDEKPYVCNKCGRCFARESALISHSQIHAQDSHYECSKCGTRFFTLELLRDHTIRKHDTPYTGETSDSSDNRVPDKSTYTGDERFGTFHCPVCPESFHKLDLLKRHKRMHTRKEESQGYCVKCTTCGTILESHEKLLSHLESNSICQRHVCLLCGERFSDQGSVERHIQHKHIHDITPTTCIHCGKQCKDRRALQKHYWIHSTDKKYSCKKVDCLKKFHSWARLRRHMQSHNASKVVRCDECDEMFPDRRALINHRHSHFPEFTVRKFMCNECGKSFGSRSSQQIHNRIHTGERPYGCRYCWKAFADGGTLRKHERIHTGEKPYMCVVCPRAFNQRVVLREHIRSHHSGSVTKPGYSTPVYQCSVCGIVAVDSDELAVHLVKHSDDNTLKNRNPQPSVRTYHRRRKCSSFEYDENEFEDADFFEKKSNDTESGDSDRETTRKAAENKRVIKTKKVDNYAKLKKTFEAAIKNINSMVETKPARKAKMITTKPKPAVKKVKSLRKEVVRKRNASANSVSGIAVNVRPRTRTLSGRLSGRKDSFTENTEPSTNLTETARMRPPRVRTRSINYDSGPEMKKTIRKPAAYLKKDEEEENVKTEMMEELPQQNYADADADGDLRCGICSQMFYSKTDLLSHVPVHI